MKNGILIHDEHISLTSSNDLINICNPLFDNSPINYFHYAQVNNNKAAFSTTHPNWAKIYFKNIEELISKEKLYYEQIGACENKKTLIYKKEPAASLLAKKTFNIDSFIQVVNYNGDHYEEFAFATCGGTNIFGYYLNNIDILYRFILYFTEKASELIDTIKNHTIQLPYNANQASPNTEEDLSINKKKTTKRITKSKKIPIEIWL